MRHPVTFTFLGFYFNSLVDAGEFLDLQETHNKIRSKQLFDWLMSMYSDRLDISLFTKKQLGVIEDFFEGLSTTTDEARKMGIEKNGLCLLVAYCLEGAQRDEKHLR
jgi:hypothetical protein